MKTNTFITLSTATANIGVLVGLVFLIFELRQTSAIALSEIRQERTLSIIDEYTSYAKDEQFNSLLHRAIDNADFDSVSEKEWGQIRHYELARGFRLEDVFFQYQGGLIDESAYRFSLAMAASRTPLWKWLRIPDPNPKFRAAIESYIKEPEFKESNFAMIFKKWSEGKTSPSKGLGSPFVFE